MRAICLETQTTDRILGFHSFDLPSFVLQAFANLKVNVELISSVNIGDYSTVLSYTQPGVPAYTGQSLTVSFTQ